MSQELFEKYMQGTLTDDESRQLKELLVEEAAAREFVAFVQEWTVMADVSRQFARNRTATPRPGVLKARRSGPLQKLWFWWACGTAASILFAVAVVVSFPPERAARPVAREAAPRVEPLPPPSVQKPRPEEPRPAPAPPPVIVTPPAPFRETRAPAQVPKPEPPPAPPVVPPLPPEPRPAPTVVALAELTRMLGEVQVDAAHGRVGQAILPGQGIRTEGRGSGAVIKYPDGTIVELGPNSRIDALLERGAGKRIVLAHGVLTAQVTKQPAGHPLVVATAHAESIVVGTRLVVTAEPDFTRLDVHEGRVKFSRLSDGSSLDVTAGRTAVAGKSLPWEVRPVVYTREFQDSPVYSGTRDTMISEVESGQNFGTVAELEADGDDTGGKSIWALIRWDISELPAGAIVDRVVMTLHVQGTSKDPQYSIFEMKQRWVETEATWRFLSAGRPWRALGAKASLDRGEIVGTFAPREKGYVAILMNDQAKALVQAWIRNPASNNGILIGRDASTDGFKFDSREASTPVRRPKLAVTYSLAPAK